MRLRFLVCAKGCLLLAIPRLAGAQSAWTVNPAPIITIGGANGGAAQELNRVTGALLLADGRVVVANGKPLELRVYSPKGALLARIGRDGQGPGEFSYETQLIAAGGDSVVVFTGGSRWEVFHTDGKLAREWTVLAAQRPHTTFYRRAYTRPISTGIDVCTRRVIETLPVLAVPGLHEVFADEGGRYWVRAYGDANHWTVYSRAGRSLGTVSLPAKFDLFQVGSDFVVGRSRDQDDVEQVVAYRLTVPAAARLAPSNCGKKSDSLPVTASAERMSNFRMVLRNAETSNEAVYSASRHYARTADALRLDIPSGAKFYVLRAEDNGYVIGIFDLNTNFFCAVGVNSVVAPVGWGDGEIRCGH